MRTKAINYVENTVEEPLGYIGEHNETQLLITPPTELAEDTDIVSYSLAFGVNGKTYHSATVVKAETFTVDLWQEITQSAIAYMQIEGYDANGDILAKSKVLSGKFLPSVKGAEETADFTPPIIAEIAANTAARHTHSNKSVLDEIGDSEGKMTYRGSPFIDEDDLDAKQDKLTAGSNITIVGNTISSDNNNSIEIMATPGHSNYTAAQLITLYNQHNFIFTYDSTPVVWIEVSSGKFYFSVIEKGYNSGMESPVLNSYYVNAGKQILGSDTMRPSLYIPYSINGKTFANIESITLVAGDIQAAAGWTPSANTDLATKKYVDDNAGGTPDWSDIQNKPVSYPPSAHTHAYSEITGTPDLSGYATKDYVDTLVGNADTLLGSGVIE